MLLQELRSLVDGLFDGGLLVSENGGILHANRGAWDMFSPLKMTPLTHVDSVLSFQRHCLESVENGLGKWDEIAKLLRSNEIPDILQAVGKDTESGLEFQAQIKVTQIMGSTRGEEDGIVVVVKRDSPEQRRRKQPSRASVAINHAESVASALLEASFDAIFQINERGIIQKVNKSAELKFGWTREELIGQNISILAGGEHAVKHDRYIQSYLETGVSKVIGKKRELPARRKDGTKFPMELGVVEVESAYGGERLFCGYVHDLTVRKRNENEIKRREEFTNRIIEASYDALFVIDCIGDVIRVNATVTSMFGWDREEIEKKNISCIFEPSHGIDFLKELEQFALVGMPLTAQREVDLIKRDGSSFPAMLGVSDLEGENSQRCVAVFAADLTDKKKMMEVEIEKAAVEFLLLNVLPEQIACRLREDPSNSIAEHHKSATILFADIVGFTAMSSRMRPEDVVAMLNDLFTSFDDLVEKYDLNKIKTIGDCYMVTSVPTVEHEEHECARICHFALDMIDALNSYNKAHMPHELGLRVGINAGPVVAGVVGTKRFLYDLWGDAVNLASRMESTGIPGKIQVTKEVTDLVGDSFRFTSRGMVHVKGKGQIETFLIEGRKRQPRLKSTISVPENSSVASSELLRELNSSLLSGKSVRDVLGSIQKLMDGSASSVVASPSPKTERKASSVLT